jgi:hypothetical protein
VLSCCPFWKWCTQMATSYCAFSSDKMAKHQSSVREGDSGDSSIQLRWGVGGCARPLAVGPLRWRQWRAHGNLSMRLDSKFCNLHFLYVFVFYLTFCYIRPYSY